MNKFAVPPYPDKPPEGHPDIPLCDLRNNLTLHLRGYATPDYKAGVQHALKLVNEMLKYRALARERDDWDKKGGAPEYV